MANADQALTLILVSDPASMVDPASESDRPPLGKKRDLGKAIDVGCLWIIGIFIAIVVIVMFKPISRMVLNRHRDLWEQQAIQIGRMMFSYSVDHDGKYPSGNSSTEVFQKLLDGLDLNGPRGHYAYDPNVFYIPLVGKSKPVLGQKLKPQNVGFDVTADVTADDSDDLPIVFLTGYKVTFSPGGTATPIPNSGFQSPWPEWLMEFTNPEAHPLHEMAVYSKGNTPDYMVRPEGFIPNFISPNFDARGKIYRQLTPDGPLR